MKINIEKGRYWQEGVELVSGCSPCSPGCAHCWSAAMTHRFKTDLTEKVFLSSFVGDYFDTIEFTGKIITHPDRLKRFNTRKSKVFAIWNDTFHLSVPFEFIDEFHKVNMNNLHNTVLILTKRPERMKLYYQGRAHWENEPNIYKGLTVCNQQEADEKIPIFLQVPGKKFLSIEPALSHINIERQHLTSLNLVIYGAETGAGARQIELNWVRSMMVDCQIAGVHFFLKQLDKKHNRILDGKEYNELPWAGGSL